MSGLTEDFYTSDEKAAFEAEASKPTSGSTEQDIKDIWFAARAWFTRDTATEKGETELSVDTSYRDREARMLALQNAVQVSQRGNVTSTASIIKTAKEIEDYLVNGTVPQEPQAS